MGFKLKSGNTSAFKMMGSSPAKMHKPGHEGKTSLKKIAKKIGDPLGLSNKFNIGGYLKGEQGYIPDYKGESTKKTVNKVARKVVKATTDPLPAGRGSTTHRDAMKPAMKGAKQSMKKVRKGATEAAQQVGKKYTKMRSDLKMKPPYKKPVGPRATKKKIKENNNVPLSPGYEDPVKIQKVQREGLTPNSQKFSKIAKKNAKR